MLSRPSPSAVHHLAKATLIAAAASLLVGGGLTVARLASDPCAIDTRGLDSTGRTLVARRQLACSDYEHGRISKDDYHRAIETIDVDFVRPLTLERVIWASSVLGVSTEYSETSWSAHQALGAPNVYPQHGDIAQAWASKSADDHPEWIELGYATPRAISAVEIYETFNPGAISTVELITTSGRRIELRPSTLPTQDVTAAKKLVVETQCTSEPIAAVKINLASDQVTGWNEIDAVGLVPCTAGRKTVARE